MSALFLEGATTHLRLRRASDVVTLRLFSDPRHERRVYRRAGAVGITHVEATVPTSLVSAVGTLQRALERGVEALDDGLDRTLAEDGSTLEVLRATFDDQRIPRWPPSMRSGPHGPHPWSYDAELEGLLLGLRMLIRREWLASDEARADDERWLASNGLCTRAVPAEGARVAVLAANDPAVLETAAALEALVERPSPGWEEAASEMGALLGYPSCCVRAFVSGRARDDASLFAERLPPTRHRPLSSDLLWLNGALTLISHAPCEPECPATRALAAAVRASLGARADARARLAARLHAITRSGRVLAIDAAGSFAEGLSVNGAIELAPNGAAPIVREVAIAPVLTLEGLAIVGLGEPCTLFSDHRGARSDATSSRSPPSIAGAPDPSLRIR